MKFLFTFLRRVFVVVGGGWMWKRNKAQTCMWNDRFHGEMKFSNFVAIDGNLNFRNAKCQTAPINQHKPSVLSCISLHYELKHIYTRRGWRHWRFLLLISRRALAVVGPIDDLCNRFANFFHFRKLFFESWITRLTNCCPIEFSRLLHNCQSDPQKLCVLKAI